MVGLWRLKYSSDTALKSLKDIDVENVTCETFPSDYSRIAYYIISL